MTQLPHYTALISEDNFKKIKEDSQDEFTILASKDCLYTSESYMIIEFALTDITASDDLAILLDELGALILHEELTRGFLILEEDIPELAGAFAWDGALTYVMGEMLTIEDRKMLLHQIAQQEKLTGDIKIKCKDGIYRKIEDAPTETFDSKDDKYIFGATEKQVWWAGLLDNKSGYQVIIQKEEEDNNIGTENNNLPSHPNPYDPNDDYYFCYPDDYDDVNTPAWYRERYHEW